jgi:hypothetical protein
MSTYWYIKRYGCIYEFNISTPTGYLICELDSHALHFKTIDDCIVLTDNVTEIMMFTYGNIPGIAVQSSNVSNAFIPVPPLLLEDIVAYFENQNVHEHEFVTEK